jgi:hypothetical protein
VSIIGTCKLCRAENIELRDSHLLSKAAYKILRKSDNGDSPVAVDKDVSLMTDSQVRGHVLCGVCEDRFNKNGEGWVLRYCYRGTEGFRLKDLLARSQPARQTKTFTVHAAVKIPEIEIDKLTYFATSVFWRSCIHEWRSGVGPATRRLGLGERYERELRAYLLGNAAFPQNAALWVHIADDELLGYMSIPTGGKLGGHWRYDFHLLGIGFTLWLGRLMPSTVRRLCFVQSPEHFIYSGKVVSDLILQQAGKLFAKTRPVGSLSRWFENRSSAVK